MKPINEAWRAWQQAQRVDDETLRHTTWAAFLLLVIADLGRDRAVTN